MGTVMEMRTYGRYPVKHQIVQRGDESTEREKSTGKAIQKTESDADISTKSIEFREIGKNQRKVI